MAIVKPSKPYTFIDGPGNTAVGAEVNNNFDILYSKVGEVIDNINNAAGSKVNLDTRLDVALNEDGTPRVAVTAGGEWINPGFAATYISATQFSVPNNHTDIYLVGRRVRVVLAASTVYSAVTASSFGLGVTTVTIDSVLTNPITSVEHGINKPVSSQQSSLPASTVPVANNLLALDSNAKYHRNAIPIFVGTVNYNATSNDLPPGWSVSKGAAGGYTITHNLNFLDWIRKNVVIISPESNSGDVTVQYLRQQNLFYVTIKSAGVLTDTAFSFMVMDLR